MARMKIETLDFEESYDIQRRRKVRMAEIANARQSSIAESESPFSKENMKTSTSKKVQVKGNERKNFCWTPKCGACGQSMTFNLGSHSRGGR